MYSHIFFGVTDFERALVFYNSLMSCLGLETRFCDRSRPWAGWHSAGGTQPLFLIGKPYNEQPHSCGNGSMVAFQAKNRAIVDAAHKTALINGGICEGKPGLRPEYHENYYGAYFRDPDGNKICIVCHAPEDKINVLTSNV